MARIKLGKMFKGPPSYTPSDNEKRTASQIRWNAVSIASSMDNKTKADRDSISSTINNHIQQAQTAKSKEIAKAHTDAVQVYKTRLKSGRLFGLMYEEELRMIAEEKELHEMSGHQWPTITHTRYENMGPILKTHYDGGHKFTVRKIDRSERLRPTYIVHSWHNGRPVGEYETDDMNDAIGTGLANIRSGRSVGIMEGLSDQEPKENGTHQRKFNSVIEKIKNLGHKVYEIADFTKNNHFFTSVRYGERGEHKEIIKTPIHLDEDYTKIPKVNRLGEASTDWIKSSKPRPVYRNSAPPRPRKPINDDGNSHSRIMKAGRQADSDFFDQRRRNTNMQTATNAGMHIARQLGVVKEETKIPKVSNLYEAYAKVYAKDTLGVELEEMVPLRKPPVKGSSEWHHNEYVEAVKRGDQKAQREHLRKAGDAAAKEHGFPMNESRTTGTRRTTDRGKFGQGITVHNFDKIPTGGSVYDYTQTATLPDGQRSKVRHGDVLKNLPDGGKGVMLSAWPVRITGDITKRDLERVAGATGQSRDILKLVGPKDDDLKPKHAIRFRQTMEEGILSNMFSRGVGEKLHRRKMDIDKLKAARKDPNTFGMSDGERLHKIKMDIDRIRNPIVSNDVHAASANKLEEISMGALRMYQRYTDVHAKK